MPKLRSILTSNQAVVRAGMFVAAVTVLLILLRIPIFGNVFMRIGASVVRLATGVGNGLTRLAQPEHTLVAKYQACEQDRMALAVEKAEYIQLQREVDELQKLLDYRTKTGVEGAVAHVLARSVDDDGTLVLIDKGSADNIQLGSAVVIGDGVLFGVIDEVKVSTSTVRLVSNSGSKIPAAILGQTRTIGLVEGREGALLTMEFIPQDADLGTGNLVVTSGLDGQIAEGLVIGLVTEVVAVNSAPFQQAFIELLYEPREWTTVFILPPPGV